MADSSWTQGDIDTLKAAIRTGAMIVSYDGPPKRSIQYQSLEEMRNLLASMIGQVEDAAGNRNGVVFASFKKGFDP